jgi:hypothetical protein
VTDVQDPSAVVEHIIQDPVKVARLLGYLRRSERIGEMVEPHYCTHSLDVAESGCWLYDATTGEFAMVAMMPTPLYRIREADKKALESLWQKTEPNTPSQATSLRADPER